MKEASLGWSISAAGRRPAGCSSYLLVHDDGQLPGQVSVVGLHLVMILLLVLLDETLIDAQAVAAGLHEIPVDNNKVIIK